MTPRQTLTEARRLLAGRQVDRCVELLSPQVFEFRNSAEYYYLLGLASLQTGDYQGSYSYFKRGEDLEADHCGLQLGLALVYLRRKEEDQAIRSWLQVLELQPKNRQAQMGLEMVRGAPAKTDWRVRLDRGDLRRLLPIVWAVPRFQPVVQRWLVAAAILLAVGLAMVITLPLMRSRLPDRLVQFSLNPGDQPTPNPANPGFVVYTLAAAEIQSLQDQIREAFRDYRDNYAQRLMNRLLFSNAPEAVKSRIVQLQGHLKKPDFTNFRDNVEPAEVAHDPLLYRDTFTRWSGRVANLQNKPNEISFEFLIGYQDKPIVEASFPAKSLFAVELHNGDPIELISRIQIDDFRRPEVQLVVVAVRQLRPATH